jgi:O-glycosyl hydrolase
MPNRLARLCTTATAVVAALALVACGSARTAVVTAADTPPAIVATVPTNSQVAPNSHQATPHVSVQPAATAITVDAQPVTGPESTFEGLGAISGGGGNIRLEPDYSPAVQQQIMDLLFKPGYGADLDIFKIEIGAGSNTSDGSEPSVEPRRGQVNCGADYEFAVARQAQQLNPNLKVYALQWAAPGWAGDGSQSLWTPDDVGYVMTWLGCARKLAVKVSYVGMWNERGDGSTAEVNWAVDLRDALNTSPDPTVRAIQIVADDSLLPSPRSGEPGISAQLADDPRFNAVVSDVGTHDPCGIPSNGYNCTRLSRKVNKPVFISELGMLPADDTGAAILARSINESRITAGVVSVIVWPMINAMPGNLPYENRGLLQCSSPWSGSCRVTPLLWVIAQTTQFVQPGWKYVPGGMGQLRGGGSVVTYRAPSGGSWSVVAETTSAHQVQYLNLHVGRGLSNGLVQVWSTNLKSGNQSDWFVKNPTTLQPVNGNIRFPLLPGHVYTLTTVQTGNKGPDNSATAASCMPLPYTSQPDSTGIPKYLAPQEGMYGYIGLPTGEMGDIFIQTAAGTPAYWGLPKSKRFPFALIGSNCWRNDTIQVSMRMQAGQSAGLLGRCQRQPLPSPYCYSLTVNADGSWRLGRMWAGKIVKTLAFGRAQAKGGWFTLRLTTSGTRITAWVNGTAATRTDPPSAGGYVSGPDGIETGGYYPVQYKDLEITAA